MCMFFKAIIFTERFFSLTEYLRSCCQKFTVCYACRDAEWIWYSLQQGQQIHFSDCNRDTSVISTLRSALLGPCWGFYCFYEASFSSQHHALKWLASRMVTRSGSEFGKINNYWSFVSKNSEKWRNIDDLIEKCWHDKTNTVQKKYNKNLKREHAEKWKDDKKPLAYEQ